MTYEPGLDQHNWETEFAQLEPELRTDPIETLPTLADLVERMLIERGYELDPASRDERGLVPEYLAAKEIASRGSGVDPGDAGDAIEKLLAIYEFLITERRAP